MNDSRASERALRAKKPSRLKGLVRKVIHTKDATHTSQLDPAAGNSPAGDGSSGPINPSPNPLGSLSHENDIASVKSLGNEISKILESNEIGLLDPKSHFPDSEYSHLFTRKRVEEVFPNESEEFIYFICGKATRLFAITVLSNESELLPAMKAFCRHKVTDAECLPILRKLTAKDECAYLDDVSECSNECIGSKARHCNHDAMLDVFHHKMWGTRSFSTFFETQWSFLLQSFRHDTFTYDLHDHRILPFKKTTEKEGKIAPGHFSIVTQTSMLAGFQDTIDTNGRDTFEIAIKKLLPLQETGYNIVDEWNSEANAHKTLDGLKNKHITRGIAAYCQHGNYNIILEWANGGNLRSFWRDNPNPEMSKKTIMELLRQLYGLADALASMHHTSVSSSRSKTRNRGSSASSASGIQTRDFQSTGTAENKPSVIVSGTSGATNPKPLGMVSPSPVIITTSLVESDVDLTIKEDPIFRPPSRQATRFGENWRHGDIKPENILRFKDDGSWLGTLKLADLGRAKQRYLATRELPVKEIDSWRTQAYEAPDIWIGQGEESMSRFYDCWAMGCVFFEAIVWMLYGWQGIWNFETKAAIQKEGTPYWTKFGDWDARVSGLAQGWMDHILYKDPECNSRAGTVLGDLMRLVKEKLLRIHIPPRFDMYTKGLRANSKDMCQDLAQILVRAEAEEKGETNDRYIFTGSDRKNIQPPLIDHDSTPLQESKKWPSLLSLPLDRQGQTKQSLSVPPLRRGGGALTTRRQNQYTHSLNDVWNHVDDDEFAILVLQQNRSPFRTLFSEGKSTICQTCQEIGDQFQRTTQGAGFSFDRSMKDLRIAMGTHSCGACALLYNAATNSKISSTAKVTFSTSPAGVRINEIGKGNLVLRFCRSWDLPNITDNALYPPIGLPRLPEAGSIQHVNILRAWLDDCDVFHSCVRVDSGRYCPKRLLDVCSEQEEPKLIETEHLSKENRKNLQYVALSHPWGDPTRHEHFRTTTDTIKEYMEFVMFKDLPKTFQDAVKITRGLDIKYIWIDSICIHQGDDGDFNEQAPFMQEIFGSAYCVLAASSAEGMESGFLKTPEGRAVAIPTQFGSTRDKLFISETIDDFQQDVLESHLNTRGWVFQERALARRTIFFAKNQTYFECANGVRCESFSKLENSEEAFLGDSNFPQYVMQEKNKGAQQYLFESLYRKYSRLQFSERTDKPIAISGLEQRLLKVFEDRGGAGIFEKHWGRCLLWKRASKDCPLERIDFKPPTGKETPKSSTKKSKAIYKFRPPPTWSWMSYIGSIDFIEPPGSTLPERAVAWNVEAVTLHYTGDGEMPWFYANENMTMSAEARPFKIGKDTHADETMLTYDDPAWEDRENKKCIIIGSRKTMTVYMHYVLIVSPFNSADGVVYERIGVGYLPGRFIEALNKRGEKVTVQ